MTMSLKKTSIKLFDIMKRFPTMRDPFDSKARSPVEFGEKFFSRF